MNAQVAGVLGGPAGTATGPGRGAGGACRCVGPRCAFGFDVCSRRGPRGWRRAAAGGV
ncbi:hypothetical protein [Streptomyces sp. SR-10]|uniref:hypothetical protein n=1 Tax=Streptomyces sp. SR-10 TaxID=3416442 RepID=UPI003CF0C84A